MEPRYLTAALEDLCFPSHKIALMSGPRQSGKTTLAKMALAGRKAGRYATWDDPTFRRAWAKDPRLLVPESDDVVPLLVLDEIHKNRLWKRTLKGLYDGLDRPIDLLVTGSARLNMYRRGGDSLLGRALHLRLHQFSLAELSRTLLPSRPEDRVSALFARSLAREAARQEMLERLLHHGGFPDPFLRARERWTRVWRRSRTETIIREDLRDLTRLPELDRVEMLAALLPERVASLLSRAALAEDLEVSFGTVTRWLTALQDLYYAFEVKPWTRAVVRSLRKEGKLYLWDWGEVSEPGPRFENLVACHLLKACDYWTDTGEGTFSLYYLRNKEKEEIDFLVTCDRRPWLLCEAKLSDTAPVRHLTKFMRYLDCRRALQLVASPGVWRMHACEEGHVLVASAAEALAYLV